MKDIREKKEGVTIGVTSVVACIVLFAVNIYAGLMTLILYILLVISDRVLRFFSRIFNIKYRDLLIMLLLLLFGIVVAMQKFWNEINSVPSP